ncbi:tail protein X [Terrarubrum flagellatum]|uniref:tail protein X n=1 Tax=Terrirubrum flagellatum TaxID=2895980 RepID=UPI0031451768
MATVEITVKQDGVMLDLLLWRRFKALPDGFVEQVYEMNYGLAEKGEFLPLGTVVVAPIPDPNDVSAAQKVVSLWD